jgi:uncharacterized protein
MTDTICSIAVIVASFIFLVAVLLTLPGTWMMLAGAGLAAWLSRGLISPWTLAVLLVLAVCGEVLETFSSSAGARWTGASRWGGWGAVLGSVPGVLAGTLVIPVPVVGSLIGACLGAAGGAMLTELAIGRPLGRSARAGVGAGLGRLAAVAVKFGVAAAMWVVIVVAALVP